MSEPIRLTQYSHGAGCGCKISPKVLDVILAESGAQALDPNLWVGNASRDDAAVYALDDERGVVSTTDFFMPIVDDPYDFGRIAATNAISDIYAMGGDPLMAIAILGWPVNVLPPEVAREVIRGGRAVCAEAGIPLAGGHSIDAPEPIFGLAVTGVVSKRHLKRNDTASAGCQLYLTKPLGIGILTTAEKKAKLRAQDQGLARDWMCTLNTPGSRFGKLDGVKAMTDVTGFGLLGRRQWPHRTPGLHRRAASTQRRALPDRRLHPRRNPAQLRQLRAQDRRPQRRAEAPAVRPANQRWPVGGRYPEGRSRVPCRGRRTGPAVVADRQAGRATEPRGRGDLMRPDCTDFRQLFLDDVPMMDMRAPVEFAKGAFPGVVNLPLMNDQERQKVGTCYKQQGQAAAIALGHQLVSGTTKQARMDAWVAFTQANPQGYLYCFRGGLRSQIVQGWLRDEAGIQYPRVKGGYKAMRTFLLETTQQAVAQCDFVLLGGLTGTGKTDVLHQLDNVLDLEGHANHRGSSFGKRATAQPAQIDFENQLAIDVLKKRARGCEQFVLEDEGRIVGSCTVPLELYQGMQQYPLVWLEDSFANRVERILRDYVVNLSAEFIAVHGEEDGRRLFAERMLQSMANIYKRLGGERYQRLSEILRLALEEQQRSGAVDLHRGWIEGLLNEYYDPMYAYQRAAKAERIEFAGDAVEVREYLKARARRQPHH